MTELLQSRFVGVHELRRDLSSLLDAVEQEDLEIVLTRQGKPAAVVLSVERFVEMQEALKEFSDPAYFAALLDSRDEIRRGEGVPAEEVFREKGL